MTYFSVTCLPHLLLQKIFGFLQFHTTLIFNYHSRKEKQQTFLVINLVRVQILVSTVLILCCICMQST